MLTLISICFLFALLAPWVYRSVPRHTGLLLAAAPVSFFVWLLIKSSDVMHGHAIEQTVSWVEGLRLEAAFRLDGLSLLFALLISGIGALIVLYTQGYFKGHPQQGRFMMYIIAFMASMLGVVLSDHLLLVFIFWELTSFTSYLLIGFNHESEAARKAALQSMLVTVLGGLFLLAGMILMAEAAGTWRLSELIRRGDVLTGHAYYLPILILICIGAFTKSAQFPFHFWLPNAMQAPTPASAYLHSSTMVKAGVYLLARLHPALGGTTEWAAILTTIGATTFVLGAVMALGQHVLKRLLAYTTVSALGAMIMLLGIGTEETIKAMAAFILAHAFYKAALFLVAGGITHETGGETYAFYVCMRAAGRAFHGRLPAVLRICGKGNLAARAGALSPADRCHGHRGRGLCARGSIGRPQAVRGPYAGRTARPRDALVDAAWTAGAGCRVTGAGLCLRHDRPRYRSACGIGGFCR